MNRLIAEQGMVLRQHAGAGETGFDVCEKETPEKIVGYIKIDYYRVVAYHPDVHGTRVFTGVLSETAEEHLISMAIHAIKKESSK